MIAKFASSLKDNIIQKSTNPFLGTLILVWIFHNWKLVFTLFNFEESWTLEQKWEFIGAYLEPMRFSTDLIRCITIATAVLFITYFLLNMSRLIVNFYEKIVSPWIYQATDKSSIVLKSQYKLIEKERDLLEQRLEEERSRRVQMQNELDKLEQKGQKENTSTKELPLNKGGEIGILNMIDTEYTLPLFEEIIDKIYESQSVDDSELLSFLLKYDYIEQDHTMQGFGTYYKFTSNGANLKHHFLMNYKAD